MWMPTHPVCQAFGMTRDRFCFLWRYFHLVEQDVSEDENYTKENEEDIFEWDYVRNEPNSLGQDEYDEETRHWFYEIEPLMKQLSQFFV